MAPDGYLTAPAQSALLDAYGGGALAAAAQALADDVRATFAPLRDPDVPPFMRAAVRNALTSALARLRAAHAAGRCT
ncbi:unnamed protein product, partial [Symbiodinium microadriaticum]